MNMPLILRTDSYKYSHYLQYPEDTEFVNSYVETRVDGEETVFFGLQAFIKEYLMNPIKQSDIDLAEELVTAHGEPFNRKGWEIILHEYRGFLPIYIEAVPEGFVMGGHNVQVQVKNMDRRLPWLTSFVETSLLRGVWYPSTVATISRNVKKVIKTYLEKTSDFPAENLPFKLHDFGARGVSSAESAGLGGLAHLVNFMGTDTVESLWYAQKYYGFKGPAGFSIPAAEHSTITSWGANHEREAFENMIDKFAGEGKLYAVVSDSYNIWNAVDNLWGKELKDKVLQAGGTLVVRPDSGDPSVIPVEIIKRLAVTFGYTTNSKGYKVLNPSIRVIQGDGNTPEVIEETLKLLEFEGFSAENIAFGMGGGLLQNVNRDTLKYAMKASARKPAMMAWQDVYKKPVTDNGKASKAGLLALVKTGDKFETVRLDELKGRTNYLEPVYSCGTFMRETTLEEVRKNAAI